jgi:hypothetical protein
MTVMPLTSAEQLTQLKPWLESFEHKAIVEPVGKFHLFTKGERTLALTQQIVLNGLFPAVNPHVCTPRETTEIVNYFQAWNANMAGGLVVAVPSKSHMHEHMSKLGYRPKAILYESV